MIVLFGATGDLAKRKLLPGLHHLFRAGLLPEQFRVIGSAPPEFAVSDAEFRTQAEAACKQFGNCKPDESWDAFAARLSFGAASPEDPSALVSAVEAAEKAISGAPGHRKNGNGAGHVGRLFHLAVPPSAFGSVVEMLGSTGLANDTARVIIEKPFGTDLESSKRAQRGRARRVRRVAGLPHRPLPRQGIGRQHPRLPVRERALRADLEPEVHQVRADRRAGDADRRAAGRRSTTRPGAYRDMVVTHLFQVLGFIAMEPPTSLAAKPLRDEKGKVFDALRPIDVRHVVRGQYEGYRSIHGVPADSDTETMIALRVEVENWRWHGVPFYLRSGKALKESRQTITLGFDTPPVRMFRAHRHDVPAGRGNEIIIDFADPGSISIEFMAKMPGPEMTLGASKLTFKYEDSFAAANALEGYERLILLAMLGDQSLFTRADGIERVWEISEPLLRLPRRWSRTRWARGALPRWRS